MSSETSDVSSSLNLEKCSLVLVDVAGTTTSIDYVKETLFSFALKEVDGFLRTKWDEENVKACVELLKEDGVELDVATAVERVKRLTDEKSVNKGLKDLQGLIYAQGYEKGDLKAHVFEDVPEALEAWAKNWRVAVYSTGSVDSQKMLFGHTTLGDLTSHVTKYFDQEVGPKTESESYKKIAKELNVATEEIVFITDDPAEASAAKTSGVIAVLIKREGNAPLSDEISKEFTVISSFKDLGLDKNAKRKIEEETVASEEPPSKVPKTDKTEEESKPSEEKVEEMEVDSTTEKTEETKTVVTEETEKSEITSEKTETETEKVDKIETTAETQVTEVQKNEETVTEKTKTDEEKEKKEVKPEEIIEEENKPETTEEAKPEAVIEETKTVVEKTNGEEKETTGEEKKNEETTDAAESSTNKTEEKENASQLANGVENGKEQSETETVEEVTEVKTDETTEKVKKIEESAESKTVSVEV